MYIDVDKTAEEEQSDQGLFCLPLCLCIDDLELVISG